MSLFVSPVCESRGWRVEKTEAAGGPGPGPVWLFPSSGAPAATADVAPALGGSSGAAGAGAAGVGAVGAAAGGAGTGTAKEVHEASVALGRMSAQMRALTDYLSAVEK